MLKYYCEPCKKSFVAKQNLERHLLSKMHERLSSQKCYTCKDCNYTTHLKSDIEKHYTTKSHILNMKDQFVNKKQFIKLNLIYKDLHIKAKKAEQKYEHEIDNPPEFFGIKFGQSEVDIRHMERCDILFKKYIDAEREVEDFMANKYEPVAVAIEEHVCFINIKDILNNFKNNYLSFINIK